MARRFVVKDAEGVRVSRFFDTLVEALREVHCGQAVHEVQTVFLCYLNNDVACARYDVEYAKEWIESGFEAYPDPVVRYEEIEVL